MSINKITEAINLLQNTYKYQIVRNITNYSFFKTEKEAILTIEKIAKKTDLTIKKFIVTDAFKELSIWLVNNNNKGLGLIGQTGTGKSLIALHILPLLFIAKFNKMPSIYKSYEINEDIYTSLIKNKIIIIDELGNENLKYEFGNKTLYVPLIIDKCEQESKLFIFTSNKSFDELKEIYGLPVIDRLKKLCKIIIFKGKSLRS